MFTVVFIIVLFIIINIIITIITNYMYHHMHGHRPTEIYLYNLQIKTGGGSQAADPLPPPPQPVPAPVPQDVGGSIQTIMQCGNISETHLQFLELVGSGAGGRVYR
jgi:hypothetical protein